MLIRRLVEQALEACASTNAARRVEEEPLRRWGVTLAGLALAAVLIVLLGPAFVRNALSAILLVQRSVEAAAPYRIEVRFLQKFARGIDAGSLDPASRTT